MSAPVANIPVMAQRANTGASRFTKRFTQAQKDAILEAVLVNGHTVRAAQQMAKAGQLNVPAFEIGNYAYDIVRDGRDTFEERNETALERAIAAELKGAELDALAQLRKVRREIREGVARGEQLRTAAQTLSAVRKARKDSNAAGLKPRAKAKANAQTDEPTPTNPSVITALLDKAPSNTREGARSASITHAPNAA